MPIEVEELLPPRTALAHPAMRELRPDVPGADAFAAIVDDVQRAEGYRLAGVFEDDAPHAVAVAGFRVQHALAWGRFLYVDDLSTLPSHRRRGHGARLLDWLTAEAQRSGCSQLHLDSGVGAARSDAHRLYLNAGLVITSHHFAKAIA